MKFGTSSAPRDLLSVASSGGPVNETETTSAVDVEISRLFQVCRIVGRRHTVDARSTILAGEPVGLIHPFQVDDVV
jgi:hypothetical protein